uniref:peptidylprolyl isomerase n=1 Tax=Corethron hystrix TaxID=216773 RepID=A0A7S1FZW2_9STRA|mmetsp:Transcript_6028/g.12951  ORF Transcript_6028/g.12951 Transcript_6028/m.12951 type:complete len:237 (+) Transcript_6028:68-778(+)|eukprot:CAMPEP_0113308518 /NCGR_PEP_ID=MMETSP0010_2-20120614/6931_1 /TAXON_ID=216773 ORGANISM="Corethron hystrix, Strain 308" /NCGR_SAMPLE_ID=MMETSP0010_2 /ASSEMBLY_ACC=CAM_ASM_000155 /LENGTH=236 /DNA_ID=CAMNT_0000163589 /DNA_START=68 /DNA_END=778 /DNA_ORIENTATION=- /assembly_acc=CAM_ASM_000155
MIHKITNIAAAAAIVFASSASAGELVVDQYGGPTDCVPEEQASKGQFLTMHYTGTIDESSATGEKGSKFDSSLDRGEPFSFQLGTGQVIKGWDQGIEGLCIGARANLIIPPELGYGESGAGGAIPGGATLKFDVEVLHASDEGSEHGGPGGPGGPGDDMPDDLFSIIDTDGSRDLTPEEVLAWFKTQGMNELPEGLMESEDNNGDGIISFEEFSGPKGQDMGGMGMEMGDEMGEEF